MMNDVENPYTDWFMGEEEFYNYMTEKYPKKFIQLVAGHVSTSIYLPGETLLNLDATVIKFDATLKTIVYTGQDIISGSGIAIIGNTSNAQGATTEDSNSEFKAPHHIDVDGNVVTNWDYENNLNEARSQVSVLNNDYIDRIEDEFKKRIT